MGDASTKLGHLQAAGYASTIKPYIRREGRADSN